MIYVPDVALNTMLRWRIDRIRELQAIKITNPKKQPKRVARRKRLRRALRALDRAIANHCQEIFTP